MFNLLKKNPSGTTITLKLNGLHCTACSLTIDDELESTPGVFCASTNYAKQESVVRYDPKKVELSSLRIAIEKLGYKVMSWDVNRVEYLHDQANNLPLCEYEFL